MGNKIVLNLNQATQIKNIDKVATGVKVEKLSTEERLKQLIKIEQKIYGLIK